MKKEQWLPVPDYGDKYEISDRGRIWSRHCNRLLCPFTDADGYLKICLYKQGKRKAFRVHRLVALAFIPKSENDYDVHHRDGSRDKNHVDNLEWREAFHGVVEENLMILDAKSGELVYYCFTYKQAEEFTGISANLIKNAVETGVQPKCKWRFEVF